MSHHERLHVRKLYHQTGAKSKPSLEETNRWLETFVFDPSYFVQLEIHYDEAGGGAVFKLEHDGESVWLCLYNTHNGCYSHGFDFSANNVKLQTGYL